MEKYIHSSSETKTHLNKKEFRGPRKTRGTVSLYEEAEQRDKKPRAQCIHFMEVKHTDHEDCVISCIPNMWHYPRAASHLDLGINRMYQVGSRCRLNRKCVSMLSCRHIRHELDQKSKNIEGEDRK